MKRENHKARKKISKRSLLFRLGTVVVLIAISALMMLIGRGHTVYFDNKTFEHDEKICEALSKVTVLKKGAKPVNLKKSERGMAICIGQRCKVELEITKKEGAEKEKMEVCFKLPYNMDDILINIPAYLTGLPEEVYMEEFIIEAPEEDEEEPGKESLPGEEGFPGEDLGGDI